MSIPLVRALLLFFDRQKSVFRGSLALLFITAGVTHFMRPQPFVEIVPDYLPYPLALVYVSGFFEILGGVGLFIPRVRRPAAWGLVALLIAVFPANIYMAIHRLPIMGEVHEIGNWVRLPIQGVLILWVWWVRQD